MADSGSVHRTISGEWPETIPSQTSQVVPLLAGHGGIGSEAEYVPFLRFVRPRLLPHNPRHNIGILNIFSASFFISGFRRIPLPEQARRTAFFPVSPHICTYFLLSYPCQNNHWPMKPPAFPQKKMLHP